MKSLVVKRSVVIAGHKTSVSLEEPFWKVLKEIAASRNIPLSNLVASVDREREHANLSSAIRLFVLEFCRIGSVKRPPREVLQPNPQLGARHSILI
jgi:predicted DNA-binding ribbon-helix-helix protein